MALTCGFFNSVDGDRKYDAEDFSSFFDGLVGDGVFKNIGDSLMVKPNNPGDNTVIIGSGRAWFNHTWSFNDAPIQLAVPDSEPLLNRRDAVVLKVDRTPSIRQNTFEVVKGVAATAPENPDLTNSETVTYVPLAYLTRRGGTPIVTQPDIQNLVGTDTTPFVTGIAQIVSVSDLLAQWEASFNIWFEAEKSQSTNQFEVWKGSTQAEFNTWFAALKATLDTNVATKLQQQIVDLQTAIDTLAIGRYMVRTLDDSTNNPVLDSNGDPVLGRIVYN